MKNALAFLFLAGALLYGCALPSQPTAHQRYEAMDDFRMARSQVFNDWWGSK